MPKDAGVADPPLQRGGGAWAVAVWIFTAALAATLTHFILGIPLQVWDSFGNLTQIQEIGYVDAIKAFFAPSAGYYRPLLWAQLKTVLELTNGHYYAWYKGVQVLQIILCLGLFVRLLSVRTAIDAAAAVLALAVLVGLHTFNGTVRETFPINTFMTILVACLAVANLAIARNRWWVDAAAVVLFLFAALTVESGLLVWVIATTAYVVGLRGISGRGVIAISVLTVAYFAARFLVLDIGTPGLGERATGFGFRMLERTELPVVFGDNPLLLYAYNIAGNLSSILFSEPRQGVFVFVASLMRGDLVEWRVANVLASTLATIVIGWYGWRAVRGWFAGADVGTHGRLAVVALGVVCANAVIGYPYSKDVIMSPAGVFYALGAYVALREMLQWLSAPGRLATVRVMSALMLFVLGGAWSVRVVGLHWSLREQSMRVREDWATIDQDLGRGGINSLTPAGHALKQALQDDALVTRAAPPGLNLPALRRWVDQDY